MSEEVIICCMPAGPSDFNDNVEGSCVDCGQAIMWRPHNPDGLHMCMECVAKRVAAEDEPPQYVVTQKTLKEAREVLGYDPMKGRSVH